MVTFLRCSLANPSVGHSLNFISPKLRCFVWNDYLSNQSHSRAPSSSSSHPQSSPGPPRQELSNTNSSNHLSLPDKLSFVLQLRPIFVCVLVFVPVVFIIMFKAFHDRLVLFLELFTIWSCAASAVCISFAAWVHLPPQQYWRPAMSNSLIVSLIVRIQSQYCYYYLLLLVTW